jgi:osmotically-inducible protein OsmY
MSQTSSDDRLRAEIERELVWDFLLDESQIEVEVVEGVVTIAGTVASRAEKLVAQRAAESVEGVHDLVNAIDVKPAADMRPSDDELRAIVEQVLAWDALVPEQSLAVSVADGLVALTGTCATRVQADEAERAISYLSGVRDVLNRIEIRPPGASPGDVRAAIEAALSRRAAHEAAHLDVIVDGGVVTLRGTVASVLERRAVLGAVGHAPGITEVRDELVVRGHEPPPDRR